MEYMLTKFYYAWKGSFPKDQFSTGVSLHGHTWHSLESLAFLPGVAEKISPLRRIISWTEKRYERKWHESFDYAKGYWTSPVSPEMAYALEANQIKTLGLRPLVSLTDHDVITACEELVSQKHHDLPTSCEWTAPYKDAVLHIGVHNIPAAEGSRIIEELRAYTAQPDPQALKAILANINAFPESLVVLNHPLSDQGRIGFEIHEPLVREFLEASTGLVHALEVNALQPWRINRRVTKIADNLGLPIISGGDRHGFEPNGAINLTNAKNFPEFVHEIREEKKSSVLFMPQCRKSLIHRYAENVEFILGEYPDLPGRTFWYDRIFYQCPDGVTRPLREMINTHNRAVKATDAFVGFLGLANRAVRPISSALAESDKSMRSHP
jgi:hypothetical protein